MVSTTTFRVGEAIIADVTGDNLNDLVLLIHDRILVYPQDPGPEE